MVLTYVNPSMTRDEFKDYVLRCMCFAVLMNRIVNTKNPVCSAYQQLLMDNIIPVYGHQDRSNVHRWFINSSLNLTLCCPSIICLHYTTIISQIFLFLSPYSQINQYPRLLHNAFLEYATVAPFKQVYSFCTLLYSQNISLFLLNGQVNP